MTFEIGLTLGIIIMALVLFATEKLRVDLVALIVLLLVAITGLVLKLRAGFVILFLEGFSILVWQTCLDRLFCVYQAPGKQG